MTNCVNATPLWRPISAQGANARPEPMLATRAYARDPLPDDVTPIYAEQKTPGQEGG